MRFQDLQLSATLLRAVEEKGYTTPTPIQSRAIPAALAGRDLLGCAQTGTGKTAAFTLPILQLLDAEPAPKGRRPIRALVLTPTRELAIQIDECCRDYGCHTSLRHCVIFGGVNQRPQVDALQRGVDMLVATPGRLLDLIGQGYVSLDQVRHFVLDEADRMLDMGFIHDIRRILPLLPERKQTLFFSATMPSSIASLADSLLHDPVHVTVTPPASVVETIGQQVRFVAKSDKSKQLISLLEGSDAEAVLVFSRTKHGADRIARILNKAGIACSAIHGDKSQGAREKAMNGFKSGSCRVLIATDIAARGIDISELPLVVNYDLPEVPETYVHRIGRTGRAGCEGAAYSFCAEEEIPLLRDIEKTIGRSIPVDPTAERPEWATAAATATASKGKSPAGKQTASAGRARNGNRSGASAPKTEARSAAPAAAKQAERKARSAASSPKRETTAAPRAAREDSAAKRAAGANDPAPKNGRRNAGAKTGRGDANPSRQEGNATSPRAASRASSSGSAGADRNASAERSAAPGRGSRGGRNRSRSGASRTPEARQESRTPAAPAPEPAAPKRRWWQFGRS